MKAIIVTALFAIGCDSYVPVSDAAPTTSDAGGSTEDHAPAQPVYEPQGDSDEAEPADGSRPTCLLHWRRVVKRRGEKVVVSEKAVMRCR